MRSIKRSHFKIAAICLAIAVTGALFTNARPPKPMLLTIDNLAKFQRSSAKFRDLIDNGGFSDAGRTELSKSKILIDRMIAGITLPRDCSELEAAAPGLLAGSYLLYPTRNIDQPQEFVCEPFDDLEVIINLILDN